MDAGKTLDTKFRRQDIKFENILGGENSMMQKYGGT